MALSKIGIKAEGRQQVVFTDDDASDATRALESQGVLVEYVRPMDDDKWFTTDREGLMVTLEEGDVEFPEPIMQFPEDGVSIYGSESALNLLVDAGVSLGYAQAAAERAARPVAGFDKDDLARIADALQLAWDNANAGSHKNRDKAVRAVLRGMAGAYAGTLAKVEAMIDPAATLEDFG